MKFLFYVYVDLSKGGFNFTDKIDIFFYLNYWFYRVLYLSISFLDLKNLTKDVKKEKKFIKKLFILIRRRRSSTTEI